MSSLDEISFNENNSNVVSKNTYTIDSSWFKDIEPKEISGDDLKLSDDIQSFEDKVASSFDEPMEDKQEQSISDLFMDEAKRANDASMFLLNEPVSEEAPRTTIDDYIKNLQFFADDELNKGLVLFESFDKFEFTSDEQYDDVRSHIQQAIVGYIREINKAHAAFYAGKELMNQTMVLRQKKEAIIEIISRLMVKYDISINYLEMKLPRTEYIEKDLDTLEALTDKLKGNQTR